MTRKLQIFSSYILVMLITVATWSKSHMVLDHSDMDHKFNPTQGKDVCPRLLCCVVLSCVDRHPAMC